MSQPPSDQPATRPGYLIDARKLAVGAAAILVGAAIAALFVWMTPRAAAREVTAACGGLRATNTNPALGRIPTPAPDFTAIDHKGKQVKLSDLTAKGPVVIFTFIQAFTDT